MQTNKLNRDMLWQQAQNNPNCRHGYWTMHRGDLWESIESNTEYLQWFHNFVGYIVSLSCLCGTALCSVASIHCLCFIFIYSIISHYLSSIWTVLIIYYS